MYGRFILLIGLLLAGGMNMPASASERSQRLVREATSLLRTTPPNAAEALAKLRAATAADPRDARAWLMRGGVALTRIDAREALAALDRAAKLNPKAPKLQYLRGRAYQDLNQHDNALKAFNAAAEKDATPSLWLYRGLTNKQLKRYAEALADFDKSDRTFEAGRQATQLHRGDVFAAQGKTAEAKAAYQAAAGPDPTSPAARIASIRMLAMDGADKRSAIPTR